MKKIQLYPDPVLLQEIPPGGLFVFIDSPQKICIRLADDHNIAGTIDTSRCSLYADSVSGLLSYGANDLTVLIVANTDEDYKLGE
jgi:hypothetical protein